MQLDGQTLFDLTDGAKILTYGMKMKKRPNPVYMVRLPYPFVVKTVEGVMHGKPGDYIAHDPISGHVWPVAASYAEQHYVAAE